MSQETPRVEVLGIRHHGPGSARSVARALDELGPDLVIIEGPPELDALIPYAADPELVPPVAGLVYAVDTPRRAAFYPMAVFSPEWVALQWALAHGVDVRFADLPAVHLLAQDHDESEKESGPDDREDGEEAAGEGSLPREPVAGVAQHRPDPITQLATVAGYDDPERWWEDAVEHRRTSSLEHFAQLREAMAAVRDPLPTDDPAPLVPPPAAREALDRDDDGRREASMRKIIRAELRAGRSRIAFVCGAFHAPALHPDTFPPVSRDNALLTKLPKVKVAATWAPWSAARLSYVSGYGAGVRSPGWYRHLFLTPEPEVVSSWFVRVARALRAEDLDASTASAVEAARLAEALAAIRGRPSVGLSELTDAAQTVLTEGSELPLQLIDKTMIIGEELGRVPDSVPMVPLARDLAAQQRSLRLKVSATSTVIELDLRRESQLARSVLLHRLRLLGVPWGSPTDVGTTTGTFKEAWELQWTPALAVGLIEASLYGTTVHAAASARAGEQASGAADLAALGVLIERCLLADLPDGLRAVVAALGERVARRHDTLGLLQTVEPLARTCRYGDVRGVDVVEVGEVLRTVVVRVGVGLRAACASLDDAGAGAMRAAVEGADRGVGLLDRSELNTPWREALRAVAGDDGVHGAVAGRASRLLLDAGLIDQQLAADRLSRRLSLGAPAVPAAAWLDGFLTGDALLLIYGEDLLGIIDEWLAAAPEETFEDLLPLIRRTFSRYHSAERRQIGRHLRDLSRGTRPTAETEDEFDLARAGPAVAAVARLLGFPVSDLRGSDLPDDGPGLEVGPRE